MQRSTKSVSASARQFANQARQQHQESIKVIQNKEYQRTKAVWPKNDGFETPDWRLSIGAVLSCLRFCPSGI